MKFYRVKESFGGYFFGMIVAFEDWELSSLLGELAESLGYIGNVDKRMLEKMYLEEVSV